MNKLTIFLFVAFSFNLNAQVSRPKLIVGIVVDQMRWDYLYRYSDRYSKDGFKRILRDGFSCENTFIPYIPTYTAPGHTCVYTGSVPSLHGIIGNNWYDKTLRRSVYCTEDSTVSGLGSTSYWAKMSPRNLWANTITDELRLSNNFKSKTIAIALKDRSSVLPGGHTANAAYWYENSVGKFVSSTFYMQALPDWVNQFNDRKLPDAYLKQNWNILYPISTYTLSTADNKPYEDAMMGEDNVFEHRTDSISKDRLESFRYTPYGNSYTFEMAKAAIEGEGLGKNTVPDFLALSFSSTDYIGHKFGPNSIEIEDTYMRFDKDLSDFLKYLDQKIGKGQYLLFLTADHGVAHIPGFEKENKLPAGIVDDNVLAKQLNDSIRNYFGVGNAVASVMNYEVYLNESSMSQNKLDRKAIKSFIVTTLMKNPAISKAFDLDDIPATLPLQIRTMVANGYNQKLSGDIQFIFKPQWIDWSSQKGTTHGNWGPYDAHIPLLWFGWEINPGKLYREVYMTDIAVTLAAKLHIQMPNAAIGKVIEEVMK